MLKVKPLSIILKNNIKINSGIPLTTSLEKLHRAHKSHDISQLCFICISTE